MGSFKSTEMDVESIIFSSNEAWIQFGFLSLYLYKHYQNQWLRKKQIKTQRKDFEDHVKANIQANGKRNDDKCLLIESRISRLNSQLHEVASRLEESISEIEANERVNSEKFICLSREIGDTRDIKIFETTSAPRRKSFEGISNKLKEKEKSKFLDDTELSHKSRVLLNNGIKLNPRNISEMRARIHKIKNN